MWLWLIDTRGIKGTTASTYILFVTETSSEILHRIFLIITAHHNRNTIHICTVYMYQNTSFFLQHPIQISLSHSFYNSDSFPNSSLILLLLIPFFLIYFFNSSCTFLFQIFFQICLSDSSFSFLFSIPLLRLLFQTSLSIFIFFKWLFSHSFVRFICPTLNFKFFFPYSY